MITHLKRGAAVASAAAVALTLAACGGGGSESDASGAASGDGSGATGGGDEPVELTLAGWSLDITPEFQTLADAFEEANPNVTISIKEYQAQDDYDTQLTSDLSAGSAPDLFPIKNLIKYYYYASNGQLLDVTDVAESFAGDDNIDLTQLELDGQYYALPYRQDSWVLYYNKGLFEKAGVDAPDGSWTWDDYVANSKAVTDGLGDGTKGTYLHTWQSVLQAPARAQYPGADIFSGDLSYLEPYYDWGLQLQEDGSTVDFSTAQSQSLTYQAEFGTEKAATLPMGTWYIATLISQQQSGDANDFEWGIAPLPQYDSSTVGENVTFGDPTSWAANGTLEGAKADAAKAFLKFASGEEGAVALAEIGITPAYFSDSVEEAFFALDGVPQDELSKETFSVHDTKAENPVGATISDINDILGDLDSEIRTGASPVGDAISSTQDRLASEGLVGNQ